MHYALLPGNYENEFWCNCDSIKNVAINEFKNLYTLNELSKIFRKSERYYIRLISFEAFTQTAYNEESLVAFFESESKSLKLFTFDLYAIGYKKQIYERMLKIVSPVDNSYPKSIKLDLESYIYLSSIRNFYGIMFWTYYIPASISFAIIHDTIDFGNIDLYIPQYKKSTFELRSKIIVKNITDKTIIIAPYHDSQTRCDKRSYRIPPQGEIEIEFRSIVDLVKNTKPIKRVIKIVNYETKEEQFFTFKADFINSKSN
jgi:hypothetical protein